MTIGNNNIIIATQTELETIECGDDNVIIGSDTLTLLKSLADSGVIIKIGDKFLLSKKNED